MLLKFFFLQVTRETPVNPCLTGEKSVTLFISSDIIVPCCETYRKDKKL